MRNTPGRRRRARAEQRAGTQPQWRQREDGLSRMMCVHKSWMLADTGCLHPPFLLTGRGRRHEGSEGSEGSRVHPLRTNVSHAREPRVSQGNMRSDLEGPTVSASPVGPSEPAFLESFPTDADEYLTVDSHDKLIRTSTDWSGESCKWLVPDMCRMQRNLLHGAGRKRVKLIDYRFNDDGITMYPYHEKLQSHYDYFASTIKSKINLESIR